MKVLKNIRKTLIVFVITLLGSVFLTVPMAQAQNIDWTGGGIGGSGSGSPYKEWTTARSDSLGTAWQKFNLYSKNIDPNAFFTSSAITGKGMDPDDCVNSDLIWWLSTRGVDKAWYPSGPEFPYVESPYKSWDSTFPGATHGSAWENRGSKNGIPYSKGSIESPTTSYGAKPSLQEINKFKEWDQNTNSGLIDTSPGYVIICSGSFKDGTGKDKEWQDVETKTENNDTNELTGPISWVTVLSPETNNGFFDPIGDSNLHIQPGLPVVTEYGKVVTEVVSRAANVAGAIAACFASGGFICLPTPSDVIFFAQAIPRAKQAIEKDKTTTEHSKAIMDPINQYGMAEGGVMNVTEYSAYASLRGKFNAVKNSERTCNYKQKWNAVTNNYGPTEKTCGPWKEAKQNNGGISDLLPGLVQTTGFWQMMTVHGNKKGIDELLDSDPDLIYKANNLDLSGNISATVLTKKYNTRPSNVPLGDAQSPSKVKAKTGTVAFYDKEVPFLCTSLPISGGNGSNKNVTLTGDSVAKLTRGGAVNNGDNGDNKVSNFFEFFRDNQQRNVKVDVWYPVTTPSVLYDPFGIDMGAMDFFNNLPNIFNFKTKAPSVKPLTTTITRDVAGTPDVDTDKGGKFTMTSTNGNVKLFESDNNNMTQKNWDRTLFSRKNVTKLDGLHNEFKVQSTWASENNKPQIFNVKYEYNPLVSNLLPTINIGFRAGGDKDEGISTPVISPIEGKCMANYNHIDNLFLNKDMTDQIHKNTGSGTANNLDNRIIDGAKGINSRLDGTSLVINFIRSTTE